MQILDDCVLRQRYDVIVVGAGLGGMAAASLLAKRGLSVLVIEQQSKPGGSCTSFKRKGVVYDVGTAMLYGFGEKGFKPFRFLINELEEPIDMVAHPTLARMTYEGHEITFWPDIERFLDDLSAIFPGEREGLRSFYRDLYGMYERIVIKSQVIVPPSEFSPRQGLRSLRANGLHIFKMQSLLSTSVKDLLLRYFRGPEIIEFYDKLCSAYCYCTAEETPAVLAATMFLDNHIGGVYYPAGGAQMLPNKIEKAFERDGGQMLYRHMVDEILIRDSSARGQARGQAYGVRLSDGREILADRIVANATVWNIYGKLIRPEHIAPERLAWAQSLVPTFPSMVLYMLVDREALPEKILPWEIFIEHTAVIDSTDLTLYVNSLVDETLGPPGKLVVEAIAPNLHPWPAPDDPDYRSEAYRAQKEREAERMLEQIEQHYPGYRQHIDTLIVGTPSTIERYLLKNGGAVGGPKNAIGQQMLKRLHARSEWENLYFCGDSTVMATGAPATAVSGVGAANMVLRDLHKPEYDVRQVPRQYVHFVDLPYRRKPVGPRDEINLDNAPWVAAQCQWCQKPACAAECPAGTDIPGFLRRMEAGNYIGAARLLRERNPLAEICGYACDAGEQCQKRCYRKSFAGEPVRIAELERWACEAAGEAGWLQPDGPGAPDGPGSPDGAKGSWRAAILGGGAAGLTCAYYLSLMGCRIDLYERDDRPGGLLWRIAEGILPRAVLERNLQGILRIDRIRFHGHVELGGALKLSELLASYDAAYLAIEEPGPSDGHIATVLGANWRAQVDPSTRLVQGQPGFYVGGALLQPAQTVVQAVAEGRRTAVMIGSGR